MPFTHTDPVEALRTAMPRKMRDAPPRHIVDHGCQIMLPLPCVDSPRGKTRLEIIAPVELDGFNRRRNDGPVENLFQCIPVRQ